MSACSGLFASRYEQIGGRVSCLNLLDISTELPDVLSLQNHLSTGLESDTDFLMFQKHGDWQFTKHPRILLSAELVDVHVFASDPLNSSHLFSKAPDFLAFLSNYEYPSVV